MKSNGKAPNNETGVSAYRPQYEIVAEKIVEFIGAAHLKTGDRLPTEQKLGEQLGVSRSIVREAVKFLTATGLVAARKGVGIYIAGQSSLIARPAVNLSMTVDPEHIQALFDFRIMQEMLTTRLATEHITLAELRELEKILARNRAYAEADEAAPFLETDDAFHRSIAQATHNPFLAETISSIFNLQRWAIKIMTGGAPGSMLTAAEQHEIIFNAIKGGRPEEAAQAVKMHVETVLSAYRQEVRRRLLTDDTAEARRES
ncbi:MAG: FadR/GntR family transcriptional regulator [Ktedonobacteraceae bacterium]|nr:FadR family transcriptional regulator [Chloroflexota bacterium]